MTIESQLTDYLHQLQPQLVDCCVRLLQIPSVNGLHDEVHLAEYLAAQARALGLEVALVGEDPRRPNVIISTAPAGPTGLILIAHLDTVPPGDPDRWVYPPFSGQSANGRIYGRGAVDTKGGMAAALFALATLQRTPGALAAGRAQLICVPDEESGATGTLGIRFLAAQGLLEGLGAIYAYSGDDIILGHRGLVRYRLTAQGAAAHTGSRDWQERAVGANAVTAMARLLLALEAVETPYSSAPYFQSYRTVFTPGTVIRGGSSVNIVPDHCEALVDIRTTPEYDLSRIEPLLHTALARAASPGVSFEHTLLNYVPAAVADDRAAIFAHAEAAVQQVKGIKPARAVAGPANEGYLLIERGIPTICGLGPSGANAHAPNEYVEIEGLAEAALIYALVAHGLSRELTSSILKAIE